MGQFELTWLSSRACRSVLPSTRNPFKIPQMPFSPSTSTLQLALSTSKKKGKKKILPSSINQINKVDLTFRNISPKVNIQALRTSILEMCQPISTLTSTDATSVPLEVKDYVQRDPSFAANANRTSFDAAEGFQRDPFCTFIDALPASFIIKEAIQVEMGLLYPIVPFLEFDPIIKTVPVSL